MPPNATTPAAEKRFQPRVAPNGPLPVTAAGAAVDDFQMQRFQISIADTFLLMSLVASTIAAVVVREPQIAFIMACGLAAFIWHEPVVQRIWAAGMIGLGAGLLAAGVAGNHDLDMTTGEMIGWGC